MPELERLRANGIDDPTVLVEAGPEVRPRLFFQLVPESKVVKNRVHLDLACDDFDAEGNEFCRSRPARRSGRLGRRPAPPEPG